MNEFAPAIVGIIVLLGSLLAVSWIVTRPPKSLSASGMEARKAAAENTDAVHDSPVPKADAQ